MSLDKRKIIVWVLTLEVSGAGRNVWKNESD